MCTSISTTDEEKKTDRQKEAACYFFLRNYKLVQCKSEKTTRNVPIIDTTPACVPKKVKPKPKKKKKKHTIRNHNRGRVHQKLLVQQQ